MRTTPCRRIQPVVPASSSQHLISRLQPESWRPRRQRWRDPNTYAARRWRLDRGVACSGTDQRGLCLACGPCLRQRLDGAWRDSASELRPGTGWGKRNRRRADSSVFVIGVNSLGPGNFGIYKLSGGVFTQFPGAANKVAVDTQGKPWVLNASGGIFHYDGLNFVPIPARRRIRGSVRKARSG